MPIRPVRVFHRETRLGGEPQGSAASRLKAHPTTRTEGDAPELELISAVRSAGEYRQARLLRDGFYGVADFEARTGYCDGHRGNVVHLGDFHHADRRGQTADDLPRGGILDLAGDPVDTELITDLQAGLAANV